jgi:hypothetical protein
MGHCRAPERISTLTQHALLASEVEVWETDTEKGSTPHLYHTCLVACEWLRHRHVKVEPFNVGVTAASFWYAGRVGREVAWARVAGQGLRGCGIFGRACRLRRCGYGRRWRCLPAGMGEGQRTSLRVFVQAMTQTLARTESMRSPSITLAEAERVKAHSLCAALTTASSTTSRLPLSGTERTARP